MMRKALLTILSYCLLCSTAVSASEQQLMNDLIEMLGHFATYMKADFQDCREPNADGEVCGCFRGENTMGNDERGVRPNADLSMVCAFLVKYGRGQVTLPDGVTWDDLAEMARKSLVFAYSTHKANRLKVCAGGRYWGSVSEADHVWESSLWAMSVAYSAFFQWDSLSDRQRSYVYQLLKAECNYELERTIPTAYKGDTKAEENGWEADVLAATLGLFPDDPLAPRWFQRLREFAVNSYSHPDDANDQTVVDPDYDRQTVADLYRGQNLYDDLTLQNHNYFHTSYQNVVVQELGEAALALKLFQKELHGHERWHTNALMHNNGRVMRDVLYWLALSDGELAMPNGNDWSLFLYDQITSYTTAACFLRDPHALMLEELACRQIKARQQTTADGSWLLRPDVGARRMGVQAHRVMMSWLMHATIPSTLQPSTWDAFVREYSTTKVFTSQNIVRAATPSRFTCFSWSRGLNSYTGYISPHQSPSTLHQSPSTIHHQPSTINQSPSTLHPPPSTIHQSPSTINQSPSTNLIVPYRQHNTGNFLGWYDVEGRRTNAVPVVAGRYQLDGEGYVMNGELQTNDGALNHRFALFSTPGNAVIYIDYVRANDTCTITAERGGLMAVSVDDMTAKTRTLYTKDGAQQLDGTTLVTMAGPWSNIDNSFGIVSLPHPPSTIHHQPSTINHQPSTIHHPPSTINHQPSTLHHQPLIAFGDRTNNNSVLTAKLYALYSDEPRTVNAGDLVDSRAVVYYSNVTADETARLSTLLQSPSTIHQHGWHGVIAADPDSVRYLLLTHFAGPDNTITLHPSPSTIHQSPSTIHHPPFYPVFTVPTTITARGASATFTLGENHSVMSTLRFFVSGDGVTVCQADGDPTTIILQPLTRNQKRRVTVSAATGGRWLTRTVKLSEHPVRVTLGKHGLHVARQRDNAE